MTVVSVAQYRFTTGDYTTSDSDAASALFEAQGMVEDFLMRELELMERTEVCEVAESGFVYPIATPIISVSNPTDTEIIDGQYITSQGDDYPDPSGFSAWATPDARYRGRVPRTSITYSGGWTDATLPATLRRGICDLAHALSSTQPSVSSIAGASSVSLGDASVSWGSKPWVNVGGDLETYVPGLASRLQGFRRR